MESCILLSAQVACGLMLIMPLLHGIRYGYHVQLPAFDFFFFVIFVLFFDIDSIVLELPMLARLGLDSESHATCLCLPSTGLKVCTSMPGISLFLKLDYMLTVVNCVMIIYVLFCDVEANQEPAYTGQVLYPSPKSWFIFRISDPFQKTEVVCSVCQESKIMK